jgi:hypothetical protein
MATASRIAAAAILAAAIGYAPAAYAASPLFTQPDVISGAGGA